MKNLATYAGSRSPLPAVPVVQDFWSHIGVEPFEPYEITWFDKFEYQSPNASPVAEQR